MTTEDSKQPRKRAPRKATPKYLENAALYYLSRYSTSTENLRRVMMRKVMRSAKHHGTDVEDGAALIEAMIGRFLGSGLLDDWAYARTRADSLHRRGNSARVIRDKLKLKGVDDDVIAAALDARGEDTEDGEDPELTAAVTLANGAGWDRSPSSPRTANSAKNTWRRWPGPDFPMTWRSG